MGLCVLLQLIARGRPRGLNMFYSVNAFAMGSVKILGIYHGEKSRSTEDIDHRLSRNRNPGSDPYSPHTL